MAETIKTYRRGSRGPEVGEIQAMLGNYYTDKGGVVDNNYGSITRGAVKKWQEDWNAAHPNDQLVTDGIVGKNTMPRLRQWYQQQQDDAAWKGIEIVPPETPAQPAPDGGTGSAPGVQTDGGTGTTGMTGTIDTSNAIGSLAELLGPSPAEREAMQARQERGRHQMAMWAGLIDGLRHLGNLYYTSKGAIPQQFNDPYKMIDENYNREVKSLDDMARYRQQYAQQLYNLQRQGRDDQRKDLLAQAQADWYGTRNSAAQQKAEDDHLKAQGYIKLQNGRLAKVNAQTNRIEELTPLEEQKIRSQIYRNYNPGTGGRSGNQSTYGYRTETYYDENGRKITERTPTTGGQPAGQSQPTKKVQQPKKGKETRKTKTKQKVDW